MEQIKGGGSSTGEPAGVVGEGVDPKALDPKFEATLAQVERAIQVLGGYVVQIAEATRGAGRTDPQALWVEFATISQRGGSNPMQAMRDADDLLAGFRKRFEGTGAEVRRLREVADPKGEPFESAARP